MQTLVGIDEGQKAARDLPFVCRQHTSPLLEKEEE